MFFYALFLFFIFKHWLAYMRLFLDSSGNSEKKRYHKKMYLKLLLYLLGSFFAIMILIFIVKRVLPVHIAL